MTDAGGVPYRGLLFPAPADQLRVGGYYSHAHHLSGKPVVLFLPYYGLGDFFNAVAASARGGFDVVMVRTQ